MKYIIDETDKISCHLMKCLVICAGSGLFAEIDGVRERKYPIDRLLLAQER